MRTLPADIGVWYLLYSDTWWSYSSGPAKRLVKINMLPTCDSHHNRPIIRPAIDSPLIYTPLLVPEQRPSELAPCHFVLTRDQKYLCDDDDDGVSL